MLEIFVLNIYNTRNHINKITAIKEAIIAYFYSGIDKDKQCTFTSVYSPLKKINHTLSPRTIRARSNLEKNLRWFLHRLGKASYQKHRRCINDQIRNDPIDEQRLIIESPILILTNSWKAGLTQSAIDTYWTLADTANDLSISMDRYFLFPWRLQFNGKGRIHNDDVDDNDDNVDLDRLAGNSGTLAWFA